MKKTILLIVVAMVGIVPFASAGWFASMQTTYKYDYSIGYEPELSLGTGSIGLGSMTATATLSAIVQKCEAALWYCDENNEKITIIPK